MKVSARRGFAPWYPRLSFDVLTHRLSVVKDPIFPTSDAPKSKYEKLENRISKLGLDPHPNLSAGVLTPASRHR